jgi:hypothetical protein
VYSDHNPYTITAIDTAANTMTVDGGLWAGGDGTGEKKGNCPTWVESSFRRNPRQFDERSFSWASFIASNSIGLLIFRTVRRQILRHFTCI